MIVWCLYIGGFSYVDDLVFVFFKVVYFYVVFIARSRNRNSRIGLLIVVNWLNLYQQRFVEYVPQKL